ncbi:MAG: hypothetical protein HC824_09020 [Synechococcales cyanobacterium RM1_1_8]|nr:hypothetical protein [Synechococcales cyanobacterium RM1_1_8]
MVHSSPLAHGHSATQGLVLAQQFDQDILGDITTAFRGFVDSGQFWAMLIGFVIGYVFKGLTSYG